MIRECLRPDGVMLPSLFYIKIQKQKPALWAGSLEIVVPDSESKNASIMLILVYFVWFGEICTLFCTRSPF